MTDELSQRAERLSRELDAAFRNRADLYRLLHAELETEFGAAKAEDVMVRAVDVCVTLNSLVISGITTRKTVKSKASITQPNQAARKLIHCPLVGSRHQGPRS